MKKPTQKQLLVLVIAVLAVVFLVNTFRFRAFGRVVATHSCHINGVSYRVLLRERCISGLDYYLLLDRVLRSRVSEYEYWAELRRWGRLAAVSERFRWDSTAYDYPRIDSADPLGTTVALDPRPPYPSVHRFDWLATPN